MAISLANQYSPTRLGLPPDEKGPQKLSMWHRLGLRRLLGRDDRDARSGEPQDEAFPHSRTASTDSNPRSKQDNLTRRLSRRVGVGLPRSTTFKRQISERRDQLAPLEPEHRRAQSADRRSLSAQRTRSPPPVDPRLSLPEVQWLGPPATTVDDPPDATYETDSISWDPHPDVTTTDAPEAPAQDTLEMELERRWILNLSMHFRDRSEREKFFVTYAETPTRWRRVTISCDYRAAPPDSLEQDLKELRYQRDKCARIYESIRESLAEIQFYDTVTNLKVETRDGRLHVHVTEDVNETIPYPPISSIGHLPGARCVPEQFLHFESHLSGFVYKVRLGGHAYIKKEIPGPDTVDEFLYEINALHALNGAPNVIQVEGIVVDERQEVVKGLLINYAEQGAMVDILYEQRGQIAFGRRERWAKQIVQGLCEIHESGYVQGDFTLSNIVVDGNDNAHIIDINRRGCPVGWEPPEIAAKIESNQRISMYIGVKTDLYQLGMTLWALIMEEDEPERQPRPLILGLEADVPDYYRRLVEICLSPTPRHRLSAKDLLSLFPTDLLSRPFPPPGRRVSGSDLRPIVTKGNCVGFGPPLARFPSRYSSKTSFDQAYHKPHSNGIPQPIFSEVRDQGKGSTPTLAGSNRGAAFSSRQSSASTLNHHEHEEIQMNRDWDTYSQSHRETRDINREEPAANNTRDATPSDSVAIPSTGAAEPPASEMEGLNIHERENKEEHQRSIDHDLAQTPPSQTPTPISPMMDGIEYISGSPADETNTPDGLPTSSEIQATENIDSDSACLIHSVLPINPAHTVSRRRTFPAVSRDTQTSPSSEPFKIESAPLVEPLCESLLPINPAFGASDHKLIPSLLESKLPINPAHRQRSARFS